MKNVNLHLNLVILLYYELIVKKYLPEEQDIRKTANTSFVAAPIFSIVRLNRGGKCYIQLLRSYKHENPSVTSSK